MRAQTDQFLPVRRNNFIVHRVNAGALGVRAWGEITMTDRECWKERRDRVARYRAMEQEATDPLAMGLIHDIVLELESDLNGQAEVEAQLMLIRDCGLEPGRIEFHGRSLLCLVRRLSAQGAALDVTGAGTIPDHFTLALPLDGVSHVCSLIWRSGTQLGVAFQSGKFAYA
jgi:hypothetical protein